MLIINKKSKRKQNHPVKITFQHKAIGKKWNILELSRQIIVFSFHRFIVSSFHRQILYICRSKP